MKIELLLTKQFKNTNYSKIIKYNRVKTKINRTIKTK